MHICFQCTLDYSLWTKPKMLFLFWKMLKKTYDSDDLHSEGGTWCSQTPCEHSCSPMQSALNRSQWQPVNSLQRRLSPSDSNANFGLHRGVWWEQNTRVRWSDGASELQIEWEYWNCPQTTWENVQDTINDGEACIHTHTRTHYIRTVKWAQKQYIYNHKWLKLIISKANFRIPKRLHVPSNMCFEPKPEAAKIFINIPLFPSRFKLSNRRPSSVLPRPSPRLCVWHLQE